jgi:centromeric protein E
VPAPPTTPPPGQRKTRKTSKLPAKTLTPTTTASTMASTIISDLGDVRYALPFACEPPQCSPHLSSPLTRRGTAQEPCGEHKCVEKEFEVNCMFLPVLTRKSDRSNREQRLAQSSHFASFLRTFIRCPFPLCSFLAVAVLVRPHATTMWSIPNHTTLQQESRTYHFDHVVNGANTETYRQVGQVLVRNTVAKTGRNSAIVACGASRSGKTHTLQGKGPEPGWIALAAADLLQCRQEDCTLSVQYFVIDQEDILHDLLLTDVEADVLLRVDETQVIVNAYEEHVDTVKDVLELLWRGNEKVRASTGTRNISRGHTVFRFNLERCNAFGLQTTSTLDFVDLAVPCGPNGVNDKMDPKQLALSRVVSTLSLPEYKRPSQIGLDESKLTQFLQHQLQGKAPLAIVCCISPADAKVEETKATLKFALEAKRMLPVSAGEFSISEEDSIATIRKLREELAETKLELRKLQSNVNRDDFDGGSVSTKDAITGASENERNESMRSLLPSADENDVPPPVTEVIIETLIDAAGWASRTSVEEKTKSLETELIASQAMSKPLFRNLKDVKIRHDQLERLNKDAACKEDIQLIIQHSWLLRASVLASVCFLCNGQLENFIACVAFVWATLEVTTYV